MSAEQVLEKMISHYQNTGRVMQKNTFIDSIGSKYNENDIIEGLLMFNDYLDERREKEGA